jgi:hypothetical protein
MLAIFSGFLVGNQRIKLNIEAQSGLYLNFRNQTGPLTRDAKGSSSPTTDHSINSKRSIFAQSTMSPVPLRPLGSNELLVSALGFGAMGLSFGYGKTEDNMERFKVLDRALELGSTFWDTSDGCKSTIKYSPIKSLMNVDGDSEDLLKLWFERTGKRDQIFLATKFGVLRGADGKPTMRSDSEYVRQACEKSLKRLGVEKIDLYYCHLVDMKTPIEKTVEAMTQLKKYVSYVYGW